MATPKKITELTSLTTASADDLFVIVDDPTGAPVTKKITVANLYGNVQANSVFWYPARFVNAVTATGSVTFNGTFTPNVVNILGNTTTTASILISTDSNQNNSLKVGANLVINSAAITSGNSTIYSTVNSTAFFLGNNSISARLGRYFVSFTESANQTIANTSGLYTVDQYNTSTILPGIGSFSNGSSFSYASPAGLFVGNSTVNSSVIINNEYIRVGNTASNGVHANTLGVYIGGNTSANITYARLTSSILTIGNTSSNAVVSQNTISIGNSSVNVSITNGSITLTGIITGNTGNTTANYVIGYRDRPQNFTNTTATLALTDAGKHLLTQNSGAATQTILVPNNSSVAFQLGAEIDVVHQATGSVGIANGAGVSIYLAGTSSATSSITVGSYGKATILKIGTDTWFVDGSGLT